MFNAKTEFEKIVIDTIMGWYDAVDDKTERDQMVHTMLQGIRGEYV